MKIKEMEDEKRPREKALRFGLEALTDLELVALLLQSGNQKKSVFDLAQEVLVLSRDLARLFDIHVSELMEISGIKEVKALQVLAGVELSKRALKARSYQTVIRKPEDVVRWFQMEFGYLKQEHFIVVYLDTKSKILSHRVLFVGTLNESCVHPRDIFREAYLENASSLLLVHNHPSGIPQPSRADIECTRQIRDVAQTMGVGLMDHIIVGRNRWFSFRQSQSLD
ncbi:MAG: DNA repair protein RadC [Erysipelotrichaceae bacterium]|nr:DNA repair protein RadC [Erysipelotrichaceae bacterium]